jgi:hypothetical protein
MECSLISKFFLSNSLEKKYLVLSDPFSIAFGKLTMYVCHYPSVSQAIPTGIIERLGALVDND